jgi:general secretion pathway protein F
VAVFRYIAFDALGRRRRGLVEADTPESARESLRRRRLFPSDVRTGRRAVRAGVQRVLADWFRRDRSGDVALPLHELATLLSAGVPLAQALSALAEQAESRRVERVLRSVRGAVLQGESLSRAVERHPSHFGPVARNMIAAGETGGDLAGALRRLSSELLRGRELRSRVLSALVYPAILSVVSACVVTFLLVYVVPRIAAIYAQTSVSLPRPTLLLLATSDVLRAHWPLALLALVAVWALFRIALRDPGAAVRWDGVKLRLPFVGAVFRRHSVAEFSGTLGGLLQAGVPLVDALRVTADTLPNRCMAREVQRAASEVEHGHGASGAVRGRRVFPATVAEVIAAGEESGELAELLRTLSDEYSRQVAAAADRACRALEPLVVILMGGVVMFIVLAVLLPILRVSQIVGF